MARGVKGKACPLAVVGLRITGVGIPRNEQSRPFSETGPALNAKEKWSSKSSLTKPSCSAHYFCYLWVPKGPPFSPASLGDRPRAASGRQTGVVAVRQRGHGRAQAAGPSALLSIGPPARCPFTVSFLGEGSRALRHFSDLNGGWVWPPWRFGMLACQDGARKPELGSSESSGWAPRKLRVIESEKPSPRAL